MNTPTTHVAQFIPHTIECLHTERFQALWSEYHASHGEPADPVRVMHFIYLLQIANDLSNGDYIELGTHKGFTLKLIHKLMDDRRTLYSLDTFEGFDQRDINIEKRVYRNEWTAGNFAPTSVEGVGRYVGDGKCPPNLKIIKGWFPQSFAGLEGKRWRLVHIDFDLYQPIKEALERLWDSVVPGGVVMVHDYGCHGFPGARKAVDEFCGQLGLFPVQLTDRWGTAVIRKPLPAWRAKLSTVVQGQDVRVGRRLNRLRRWWQSRPSR
jgi:O-methyltransferase